MRKLIAALACRNEGTRLYGKPLQNLDIEGGVTILRYMVDWIRTMPVVEDIVLGVSEGLGNLIYTEVAKRYEVPYIIGDREDVLGRLIQCADRAGGTDILRLTTESPFTYFEAIEGAWRDHVKSNCDLTCLDNVPDGSGFEIINVDAYKRAHRDGDDKHRSELCSLYIRENKDKFDINYVYVPETIRRADIRLTIDYPEDLVLCRAIYSHFKSKAPRIPVADIIRYLDDTPELKGLVSDYVEEGLETMYL